MMSALTAIIVAELDGSFGWIVVHYLITWRKESEGNRGLRYVVTCTMIRTQVWYSTPKLNNNWMKPVNNWDP